MSWHGDPRDFGQLPICLCYVGGLVSCPKHPPWVGVTRPNFDPPPVLSEADVERIARRVADLLRPAR